MKSRDELVKRFGGHAWTCNLIGVDRYGRSLGKCEADGEDVEQWMVRNGWSLSFVRYSHVYDEDEKKARNECTGIWAGAFIAPWDWRSRNAKTEILGCRSVPTNAQSILLSADSALQAPSPECVIKGNMARSGECIFHEPGSRWYAKVNMAKKGNRWFCSAQEAELAGCRHTKR